MIVQYQGFNNFSKATLEKYRLKRGERAVFKLVGIRPDPHNAGQYLIPTSKLLSTQSTVFDPETGDPVDMMMIERMGIGNKPVLKKIRFMRKAMGVIMLSGDNPNDSDTYFYLMMSEERANKPGRNRRISPVYELVDGQYNAEQKRKSRDNKFEAMKMAKEFTDDAVIEFTQAMNWEIDKAAIMRDRIEAMAETDPEEFMKRNGDRNKDVKATIKRAIDSKVIVYDRSAWRFVMKADGSTIYAHPYDPKEGYIDALTDWIISHPNGKGMFELIKTRVSEKKPKKEMAEA